MIDLFSTREQATGILIIILAIYVFKHDNIRNASGNVIKTACTPKLLSPLIIMLIYGGFILYGFQQFSIWEWKFLKDIIMWFVLAGVPMCYKAVNIKYEQHYFKNILLDNLKFLVLVEFFIGTFTFNIIIELLLQIVIGFFVIMEAFTKNDKKHKQVHTLFSWLTGISGFAIIYFTIKTAVNEYAELEILDTVILFFIPFILMLLYLPVSYLITLWAKYEMIFMRMGFKEAKNFKAKFKNRIAVIFICRLSFKKLTLFDRYAIQQMYMRYDTPPFKEVVKIFKERMRGDEFE